MASSELLASVEITGRADGGRVTARAVIADAWGIVYAQGGVVMATMLHSAELVLGRGDLRLSNATATFCRPVPCGPVTIEVDVLRSGRTGAQIHVVLRCAGDDDPSPNAVATVVCIADAAGWPDRRGVTRPAALGVPPHDEAPRLGAGADGRPATNFFDQTDWRAAADQPPGALRKLAWFSFRETPLLPDGTWVPAMLAVPADALGLAVVSSVADVMGPITAPSLQIGLQLCAPARGHWLGIDSVCIDTHGATATGVATLWDTEGTLVGSATQTAALRRLPAR
jgi:acyl-coenzyme A thioesterase PaaI-like protein